MRDAVANCGGGTVTFNLAPYPATITLASRILIDAPITIAGPGAPNLTISGNNATRIFFVQSETVAITNVTLANGLGQGGNGGGVRQAWEARSSKTVEISR